MNELKPEPQRRPIPIRPSQHEAASGGFWLLGGASFTAGSSILTFALFGPAAGMATIFLLFGVWCILTAVNIGRKP